MFARQAALFAASFQRSKSVSRWRFMGVVEFDTSVRRARTKRGGGLGGWDACIVLHQSVGLFRGLGEVQEAHFGKSKFLPYAC